MHKPVCVFVFGPESSGTRLVTRFLISMGLKGDGGHHQEFDNNGLPSAVEGKSIVWRRSFPHSNKWPNITELVEQAEKSGYQVAFVITSRELLAMCRSQLENGHVKTKNASIRRIRTAWHLIWSGVAPYSRTVLVNYESLVIHPKMTLLGMIQGLDVELALPGKIERVENRNRKHYVGAKANPNPGGLVRSNPEDLVLAKCSKVEMKGRPVSVWFELHNHKLGFVMHRITKEYKRHAPKDEIRFVDRKDDAEIVVSHLLGGKCVDRIVSYGKPYAVLQHCFVTGRVRDNWDEYVSLWDKAILVMSYDDLIGEHMSPIPRFIRLPWGVDSSLFKVNTHSTQRDLFALTHGHCVRGEPIEEVHRSAPLGAKLVHLGGQCYQRRANIQRVEGISDTDLAQIYNRCLYVSALRFVEGFELPGVEGLLCGARPIVFDTPGFRHWYRGWADYIPHTKDRTEVEQALRELFDRPYRPVDNQEIIQASQVFSWRFTAQAFWSRMLDEFTALTT